MTQADSRRWIVLTLLSLTQFILVIDVSIVNVALADIQGALDFSQENLQWILSAYTLTFGGLLLLGGRMADMFGRRKVFLIGLGIFIVGSALCGFAQSELMLILARALQGVGGAIISPGALSILMTTFQEGAERNKALGIWGGDRRCRRRRRRPGRRGPGRVPVVAVGVPGEPPHRPGRAVPGAALRP